MDKIESRRRFLKTGLATTAGVVGLAKVGCSQAPAVERPIVNTEKKKKIIIEKTKKIYSSPAGAPLRYNSFTNMDFWHGKYYIVFRQAVRHTPSTCKLILLESTDLENWTETVVLDRPSIDDRDAKLLSTTQRLILYTVPYPIDSEVMYTEDGVNWSSPVDVYTDSSGDNFWKPKFYNGYFYVPCDYNNDRVDLLKSSDGLSWQYAGTIMSGGAYPLNRPTETAIVFLADGRCLALIRLNGMSPSDGGSTLPGFFISSPPYTSWEFTLGSAVRFSGHAVERFGDIIFVTARAELGTDPGFWNIPGEPAGQRTVMYTFNLKTMRLEYHAVLPTEHYWDNSYCGLLPTGKDTALVSWYDGNVNSESNIWLAHIRIV